MKKACIYSNYQNNIIKLFHNNTIRNYIIYSVNLSKHFYLIYDKGTDTYNKILLTIILYQVTDELEIMEYFLSFYSLKNIKIDYTIKCITVSIDNISIFCTSNIYYLLMYINLRIL